MDNKKSIGNHIKGLAAIILALGIFVSLCWFLHSLGIYIENEEYMEYAYTGGLKAISAKNSMIYSAILGIGSIILYFPLSGFGQLVINSDIITKYIYDTKHPPFIGTHESKAPTDLSSTGTILKDNQE